MSYSERDARLGLVAELEQAEEHLAAALAELGEAYEALDEDTADRLEAALFRPTGAALGRLGRERAAFASRHGLPAPETAPGHAGGRPGDARGAIERAAGHLQQAEARLITLQDSMLPVEVGDPELRQALEAVRELIGPGPQRVRELLRTLGR